MRLLYFILVQAISLPLALHSVPGLAFDIQGHRGARSLLPENTLPSFKRALEIGVDTIECDLAITKDGEVVIYHDRHLNPHITRGPDGQWLEHAGPAIASLTYQELQAYDVGRIKPATRYAREFSDQVAIDGTRIPKFSELLDLVSKSANKHVGIDCETKISPIDPQSTWPVEKFVDRVIAEIRKARMEDRTMIQSFDWRSLRLIKAIEPRIRTMHLSESWTLQPLPNGDSSPWVAGFGPEQFGGSVPKAVKAAGGDIWAPHHSSVTAELIKESHSLGLQLIPWTINDSDTIQKMIALGVDGIISDHPERVVTALAQSRTIVPGNQSMLRVRGTEWVDASGKRINLRGANLGNWLIMEFWMMGQRSKAIDDQCSLEAVFDSRFGRSERERLIRLFRDNWITQRDWDLIPTFGLNMVRVPFIWSLVENEQQPKTLRQDAWHYLDDAIAQARKRGLYVILDLHGAVGAQGLEHHSGCAEKNLYWSTPEYRDRTIWLWQQIAQRYKDEPVVAGYSLLNEPWGADEAQMVNAVRELYSAVRTVDANHVILLPGHSKGIDAYARPADAGMDNVAFEMHFYPGHFGWGTPGREVHDNWLQCMPPGTGTCEWQARLKQLSSSMFVGEFQPWADLDNDLGARTTRRSFDRYNTLGWAASVWSLKALSNDGGIQPAVWGLVTNASDEKLPPIDFSTASLQEIETFFRRVGSVRYVLRDAIAKALKPH
jgi:endoglucanase